MTILGDDFLFLENLILAAICGVGIFIVFYFTYGKISVNRSFAFTLLMLPPVACLTAVIISNDIFLAVGMLGALSIIRYRHSMKEAKNLVFIFWAMTAGLAFGLTQRRIAVISSIVIAVLIFTVHIVVTRRRSGMLAVRTSGSTGEIEKILEEFSIAYDIKHKSLNEASDVLYELRHKKGIKAVLDNTVCEQIMLLEGVSSVKYIENN